MGAGSGDGLISWFEEKSVTWRSLAGGQGQDDRSKAEVTVIAMVLRKKGFSPKVQSEVFIRGGSTASLRVTTTWHERFPKTS